MSASKNEPFNRGLGGDNDSAQNLISKAQIHEVIRGINVSKFTILVEGRFID